MSTGGEWLRVRGIGRERFAGHFAQQLAALGYSVERNDSVEPPESRIIARLTRMNPAVPDSGRELQFHFLPTSGGASVEWSAPHEVPEADRARLDRLARELVHGVEGAVRTESHGQAKLSRAPTARLPWERAPTAPRSAL